jgi:ABC-type nitrate/sulfonate/bicarbonate transport system substrate-binding protein
VLRYILDCHGLTFPRDYEFKPVGSTRIRLAELQARRISGAMLNPRYVEEAGAADLRMLARGRDYANPYPARVGLSTRTWAAAHRLLLVRFIAAMIRTIDWIANPRNAAEAITLIGFELRRSEAQAEQLYRRVLEAGSGLATRGRLVPETLSTVLDIRDKLGLIGSPLPLSHDFYDESFYREALSLVEAH